MPWIKQRERERERERESSGGFYRFSTSLVCDLSVDFYCSEVKEKGFESHSYKEAVKEGDRGSHAAVIA